ncbi:MAG: lysophospholipid acyltransferase family protein [Myxococcota bacterium]
MTPRDVFNAGAFGAMTVGFAAPSIVIAPLAPLRMTQVARSWARTVVSTCGVQVEAEDFDRPLPHPAYVVLSNHTSHFDVVAIYSRFPRDLFPVAKRELGKIPVFGWALRSGAAIMIDRGDRGRAKASIDAAAAAVRGGRSVLMFPEGTRSAGHELGPFKKGPFHLATAARVPVLPLAVLGASDVLEPHDWRIKPGRITVRMGRPIETDGYSDDKAGRDALAATVNGAMRALIEQRDPP